MITKWHNCYDEGWKGLIVPEAFSHPAKMSRGLLSRILAHAKEQGWLSEGDVIVDPFGGIGSTGILGAYEGYQVVCCELEQKFVDLAEQNFQIHYNAWHKFSNPYPVILQGDSRQLCQIVEKADAIISSPPFVDSEHNYKHGLKVLGDNFKGRKAWETKGGTVEKADCIVSSPPFVGIVATQDPNFLTPGEQSKRIPSKSNQADYGQTPGQLGAMKPGKVDMVVSSPPYAEALSARGGRQMAQMGLGNAKAGKDDKCKDAIGYSDNPDNLGNLKSGDVDCVISSPPYEGSMTGSNVNPDDVVERKTKHSKSGGTWKTPGRKRAYVAMMSGYNPDNKDNLGSQQGDTFWSAAKIIVQQCFQILKPGGHAIWVVKSFVRKKKIVDFPGDWQRLCESVGFKTVCIHHAMLVKETKYQTLFGDTEIKRKERKSFFKRLAESKGSPRIDFEVVLCMQKE